MGVGEIINCKWAVGDNGRLQIEGRQHTEIKKTIATKEKNVNDAPTKKTIFDHLVKQTQSKNIPTETGIFGSHMKLRIVNDGPVTIPMEFR